MAVQKFRKMYTVFWLNKSILLKLFIIDHNIYLLQKNSTAGDISGIKESGTETLETAEDQNRRFASGCPWLTVNINSVNCTLLRQVLIVPPAQILITSSNITKHPTVMRGLCKIKRHHHRMFNCYIQIIYLLYW